MQLSLGRLSRLVRLPWRSDDADFDIRWPADRERLFSHFDVGPIDPGASADRPRRVYEARDDLRAAFPYGLMPPQREVYAMWLFEHGRPEHGLTESEIVAYLTEVAEDPSHGIAATYALTPEWQWAVPHGLTRFGWDTLKAWLAAQHDLDSPWLRRAKRPDTIGPWDEVRLLWRARPELADPSLAENPAKLLASIPAWDVPTPDRRWMAALRREIDAGVPTQPAVNLVGYFRYASGLQVEIAGNLVGLNRLGTRTQAREIPMDFDCDWADHRRYQDPELFDISVIKTGAFEPLSDAFARGGLYPHPDVYRVAMWYWEVDLFPPHLLKHAELADEFWCATEFVADAFRKANPGKPVRTMLPGLELPEAVEPLPKAHFGLDPDRFLYLFMFDISSVMERKNPLGLIDAFTRAFPNREAQLAIKVSRAESRPDQMAILREAADRAGVTVIDRLLRRPEVLGLVAACDSYVSLHRSEGLGLTMAEAMMLRKPVIGTRYSGNLDFMNDDVSYLVDNRVVALGRDIPPYTKDACWAEPSVEHAAELMRRVVERPDEARAVGERASSHVREMLSLEAAARRMLRRIEEIRCR